VTATAHEPTTIGLDALTAAAAALAETFGLGGEVVPGDEWPSGDDITTLRAAVVGAESGAIYLAAAADVVAQLVAEPAIMRSGFERALAAVATATGLATASAIDEIAPTRDRPTAAVGIQDGGEVQALVGVMLTGLPDSPAPAASGHGPAAFDPAPLATDGHAVGTPSAGPLSLLHDVEMDVTVELGRTTMPIRELLALQPGMVIEIDRAAGTPIDVLVNGRLIACGEVVVIDEEFGVRITEIIESGARL
jgi:flagellar motor switch protein FliN/FliY